MNKSKIIFGGFCFFILKPSRSHCNACIFSAQMEVTSQLQNQMKKFTRQNFRFTVPLTNYFFCIHKVTVSIGFRETFTAVFVLNYWLREFLFICNHQLL